MHLKAIQPFSREKLLWIYKKAMRNKNVRVSLYFSRLFAAFLCGDDAMNFCGKKKYISRILKILNHNQSLLESSNVFCSAKVIAGLLRCNKSDK